jgi:hypothetical protein
MKNAASRPGHGIVGTGSLQRRLTSLLDVRRRRRFAKTQSGSDFFQMIDRPLSNFDLDKAIALRWALRDIVAKRLKLTPLKDDDLQTLVELGLVEMRDGAPVVTQSGLAALE